MSKINDGGPVFPVTLQSQTDNGVTYHESLTGKSLRADFAGLAMQTLLAHELSNRSCGDQPMTKIYAIARDSFACADAMLAYCNKEPK